MSVCVLAGGKMLALAVSAFSLSWTHSVEKVEWREEWRLTPAGLELSEARVRGSGAGMEPGENARLENGWWVWTPKSAPVARLLLAASGATADGWELCAAGACHRLGAEAGQPVEISACR